MDSNAARASWERIELHLVILSAERSASSLADAVGVAPDWVWERGAARRADGSGLRTWPLSGIRFESSLPSREPLESHFDALSRRLAEATSRIADLAATIAREENRPAAARLWAYVDVAESSYALDLPPRATALVNACGAWFGLVVRYRSADWVAEYEVRERSAS